MEILAFHADTTSRSNHVQEDAREAHIYLSSDIDNGEGSQNHNVKATEQKTHRQSEPQIRVLRSALNRLVSRPWPYLVSELTVCSRPN